MLFRPFRRSQHHSPLLIAERFVSPVAQLSGVFLPLDVIAHRPVKRLRFIVLADRAEGAPDYRENHREAILTHSGLRPEESLRLEFAPFDAPAGASFLLGVLDLSATAESPLAADLAAVRTAAAGRPAIGLACQAMEERTANGLLIDERGLAVFRAAAGPSGIRVAYGLDSFWCDPYGLYLRGWIHAHEHRVRALRVESAGRSTRVESFTDRPDLLVHYPAHEHVRHAGFAVYLACPVGHPVTLTLETDGGLAHLPLPLPETPLPPLPAATRNDEGSDLSPMLRRFVEMANARGGRVLQVGARTPVGHPATPPRPLLRGPVIGLDIHPGFCVDLVGDAHFLSHFLRAGSVDAVVSGSVLEHLQAPWLFAAEINRVLKPGGLVYHIAPGAWPAHSQPNDFWRMSAEGLRVLFGPESGFEILDAQDAMPATMIPSPTWREHFLDMPTTPAFAMAEILVRKMAEIQPGAVAWPLRAGESAERSRLYPVDGLRVAQPPLAPLGKPF